MNQFTKFIGQAALDGIPAALWQVLYRQEQLDTGSLSLARGRLKVQACTAVARELAGFIWAIGQAMPHPVIKA